MDPQNCARCGGPNPPDSLTCQWCGSTLPFAVQPKFSGPTATYTPPPEPSEDWGPFHRNRGSLGVRLAVIFFSLILFVALAASTPSTPQVQTQTFGPPVITQGCGNTCPVNVSGVQVISADNACGMNGAVAGGFSSGSSVTHFITWWLPLNGVPLPCSISNVTSSPSNFGLSGNYPETVTSDGTPLSLTIYTPSYYVGNLTLTVE